jgi:hypothetical protein
MQDSAQLDLEKTISLNYREGVNPDSFIIKKYLKGIQSIPKHMLSALTYYGAQTVFFNGPITDQKEFHWHKGMLSPAGVSWDLIRGGYLPLVKKVFLGVRGTYRNLVKLDFIPLHEYGHCFDDLIGRFYFGQSMSNSPELLEQIRQYPFGNEAADKPKEYVAHNFVWFYGPSFYNKGDYSMEEMRPELHQLFTEIDKKVYAEFCELPVKP